jgi:tetratricopeptide (TPR) repeat protein
MCKDHYRNEIQRVLAEQMNQEATTIQQKLAAKFNSASSYGKSGNIEASYKGYKDIIETYLLVYGEDLAYTSTRFLDTVTSLADISIALGHQEEAFGWLNCMDQGIQDGAIKRSLHFESNLVGCFAKLYSDLGQYDKALPYAKRSVQLLRASKKGEGETWNQLTAKETVARVYSNLGQRDKALPIYREMYKQARKELRSSHPITKWAKQRLAEFEDTWAGKEPSNVQAKMTASKSRSITIGYCHGIANRNDLNGTSVEIRLFSREKRQYLVRMAGGDGSQLYVKPSNILFNPHTSVYIHGLQNANQYNGKSGLTKGYSDNNGRYTVELNHTEKLVTVKPDNLLVQDQPDLVFDSTRTLAQMLSHPYACY